MISEEDRALAGEISLDEVAAAYFAQRLSRGRDDDPNLWAFELWLPAGEWWRDENRVRDGILALVDAARDDDDLLYLGAGPIEDFVTSDESRVRWIEEQARRSSRFRRALSNVWIWGEVPDEIAERVERAARVALKRPKGTQK